MAAQKRRGGDDGGDDGRHQASPYVRVSNRQRLAASKKPKTPATTRPPTAPPPNASGGPPPASAPKATSTSGPDPGLAAFYRAWQWKREHLPDRLRFHQPYRYEWDENERKDGEDAGGGSDPSSCRPPRSQAPRPPPLSIDQRPFGPEGFASTVWDSSIVVAKMVERRATEYAGLRACDLSAGCGLPAAVLAAGTGCAAVVATDLPANLSLLRQNVERAAAAAAAATTKTTTATTTTRPSGKQTPASFGAAASAPTAAVAVVPHTWGEDVTPVLRAGGVTENGRGFDLVLLCDGMYVGEPAAAVDALAASVARLVDRSRGRAIVAHGRNRLAEPAFLKAVRALGMVVEEVDRSDLHPRFVCNDVSVYRLRHGDGGGGGKGGQRERRGGGGESGSGVVVGGIAKSL